MLSLEWTYIACLHGNAGVYMHTYAILLFSWCTILFAVLVCCSISPLVLTPTAHLLSAAKSFEILTVIFLHHRVFLLFVSSGGGGGGVEYGGGATGGEDRAAMVTRLLQTPMYSVSDSKPDGGGSGDSLVASRTGEALR